MLHYNPQPCWPHSHLSAVVVQTKHSRPVSRGTNWSCICGLKYPVTSEESPEEHTRKLLCVLHSYSTSQLKFVFQSSLLCCVSDRFFRYKLEQFGAKGTLKIFRGEEASFSYRNFKFIRGIRRNASFRIQCFVAFLQPNPQFVLHGQEIVSLLFSSLCQVQSNKYLPLFPPPNPPPPPPPPFLLLPHLLPVTAEGCIYSKA
jgi:hypothetical protein